LSAAANSDVLNAVIDLKCSIFIMSGVDEGAADQAGTAAVFMTDLQILLSFFSFLSTAGHSMRSPVTAEEKRSSTIPLSSRDFSADFE
jgi:hypothetical protein